MREDLSNTMTYMFDSFWSFHAQRSQILYGPRIRLYANCKVHEEIVPEAMAI